MKHCNIGMTTTGRSVPRGVPPTIAALVLLAILLISGTALAKDKKNILIINSYHQGYKWTDDETLGAIKAFEPVQDAVKIHVEYMGTKWVQKTKPYFERLKDVYRQKYQAIPMSVIIITDNDALDFLLLYRDEVFGKVPVVFCGINWFTQDYLKGQSLYTGVNEDIDMKATIDLMLLLHPKTKRISVIIDNTTTGNIIHQKLLELVPRYSKRVTFHVLQDVTMQTIIDTVANAPPDSLALMTLFQIDAAGELFEFSESTRLISKASRVPLYGFWDFNLGAGIVGGLLTSGQEQGSSAGAMALRIYHGESPASIPVLMKSPNRYMFDFRQMERFGINPSDLPEGSILINKPMGFKDFYTQNKLLVLGTTSISLSLIAFILLISILKLKRAGHELEVAFRENEKITSSLRESESKYRMLADNVNDVVFVLDMNLNYTYISPSVETMRGYNPQELLNQPAIDLLTADSRDLIIRTMAKVMEAEKSAYRDIKISRTLQLEMLRKDGTTLWTEVKLSFFRDENQQPMGIFGVSRDITERKKVEEEIKHHAKFLKVLIDAIPYPLFYKDRQGRYLGCNRAYEKFYGRLRDQLVGKTVYDIAPKELADVYNEADNELFTHPGIQMYEAHVQSTDGVMHDVIFHKATFEGQDGAIDGLVGAIVDITEHNHIAWERERLIKELQSAISQIKTLRGIVPICSHCKKIRDDKGYWQMVEKYVSAHSDAEFSHGICPECIDKLYPEYSAALLDKPEKKPL